MSTGAFAVYPLKVTKNNPRLRTKKRYVFFCKRNETRLKKPFKIHMAWVRTGEFLYTQEKAQAVCMLGEMNLKTCFGIFEGSWKTLQEGAAFNGNSLQNFVGHCGSLLPAMECAFGSQCMQGKTGGTFVEGSFGSAA